jgi:hypothetical protein
MALTPRTTAAADAHMAVRLDDPVAVSIPTFAGTSSNTPVVVHDSRRSPPRDGTVGVEVPWLDEPAAEAYGVTSNSTGGSMLAGRMVSRRGIAVALALTLTGAATASAQPQDPLIGHWTLNAAKSSSSGPLPKKRDVTVTQQGSDVTVVIDEVMADGAAVKWSFTSKGDGKPVPTQGWAAVDTATSTLSGRTGKTVYTKGGKTVMESNTEVSADGKTLTIKGMRPGPDGKPMTFTSVYDRK